MKLISYLQKKYNSVNPCAINKDECIAFDVPYPLKNGWLEKYKNNIILDDKKENLICKTSIRADRNEKYAAEALEFLTQEKNNEDSWIELSENEIQIIVDVIRVNHNFSFKNSECMVFAKSLLNVIKNKNKK